MEKTIITTKYMKTIGIFLIAMVFSIALSTSAQTADVMIDNSWPVTGGDVMIDNSWPVTGNDVMIDNSWPVTGGDVMIDNSWSADDGYHYEDIITTTTYTYYEPTYSYYPRNSNYVGVGYAGGINSPVYVNAIPNYVGVGYQAPAPIYIYPTAQPNYVTPTFTGVTPVYTQPTYVQPTNVYPNQVLAYNDTNPSLDSVYLSDVPYTGLSDYYGLIIFISILLSWSAILAYLFLKRKIAEKMSFVNAYVSTQDTTKDSMKSDFVNQIVSDKADIREVEEYARSKKVLLSTDAAAKLVRIQRLHEGNAKNIIDSLSGNEWIAIGEGNLDFTK